MLRTERFLLAASGRCTTVSMGYVALCIQCHRPTLAGTVFDEPGRTQAVFFISPDAENEDNHNKVVNMRF